MQHLDWPVHRHGIIVLRTGVVRAQLNPVQVGGIGRLAVAVARSDERTMSPHGMNPVHIIMGVPLHKWVQAGRTAPKWHFSRTHLPLHGLPCVDWSRECWSLGIRTAGEFAVSLEGPDLSVQFATGKGRSHTQPPRRIEVISSR